MIWLIAIALAAAAFALGVFAFRIGRNGWATLGAALTLGLAGYALQANPGLPGAPDRSGEQGSESGWALVDERKEMTGSANRLGSQKLLIADALARQGQYSNAAAMLRSAVSDNPRDAEAWLALGNALVEHADGSLTQASLLAYRRAAALDPKGVGPGYFLGLALIRQGQLGQARSAWASTLAGAAPDAAGREVLAQRLERLDTLLASGSRIPVPSPDAR